MPLTWRWQRVSIEKGRISGYTYSCRLHSKPGEVSQQESLKNRTLGFSQKKYDENTPPPPGWPPKHFDEAGILSSFGFKLCHNGIELHPGVVVSRRFGIMM